MGHGPWDIALEANKSNGRSPEAVQSLEARGGSGPGIPNFSDQLIDTRFSKYHTEGSMLGCMVLSV